MHLSLLPLLMLLAQAPDQPVQPPPAAAAEVEATSGLPVGPQAYEPPAVRPFEMPEPPALTPDAPVPYGASALDRVPAAPVKVEAYRRSYEAAPDAREQLYEAGIRRNFDAAQSRMGPLDGLWTVRAENGAPVFSVLLSDPGRPDAEIEGAWRTLGPTPKSGFILSVGREGERLVVRWYDREGSGEPAVMRLVPAPGGGWRGALQSRDRQIPVTMGRS